MATNKNEPVNMLRCSNIQAAIWQNVGEQIINHRDDSTVRERVLGPAPTKSFGSTRKMPRRSSVNCWRAFL
jgi:hypothetical protein